MKMDRSLTCRQTDDDWNVLVLGFLDLVWRSGCTFYLRD